jgi:hypothetical protein
VLIKKVQRSADAVCSLTHLYDELLLETLLTLKLIKPLICFKGTRRPTLSVIEQQLISSLKTLTRNEVAMC